MVNQPGLKINLQLVNTQKLPTFSLTLTGLALKATPLQKDSTRLAMEPSRETLTFSPWMEWNPKGGRLFGVPPVHDVRGAVTREMRV